jgi:RyR domain
MLKNQVTAESIARVVHEANRAWQEESSDPAVSPHWDEAPQWQKDSAADGVRNVIAGKTARELHDEWVAGKESAGWKYGPVKDGNLKTHHCMVDYEDLPYHQKVKDDLLRAIVMVFCEEI